MWSLPVIPTGESSRCKKKKEKEIEIEASVYLSKTISSQMCAILPVLLILIIIILTPPPTPSWAARGRWLSHDR